MKLKTTLLILGATFLFTPSVYAKSSAEALFEAKCSSCHVKTRPNDISNLLAPPLMGVMRHVKMTYDSKEAALKFIVDYTLNPDESKAVCMPGKIKAFGLMPSQKGNVSKEELETIAAWAYENYGNQGRGRGRGQGRECKNK